MILSHFHSNSAIKKNAQRTDGPTDGPTDRPSYRDAWTHLKIWFLSVSVVVITFASTARVKVERSDNIKAKQNKLNKQKHAKERVVERRNKSLNTTRNAWRSE